MELKRDAVDKIYLRIEKLKEYVTILESLQHTTLLELHKDVVKKGAIERYLQLAIEACIDIAELVISDQRLPTPSTAKEAIDIIGKEGIIDNHFAKRFSKAVGFRNILIHDYVEIDYDQLLHNLKENLSDFHTFIKSILSFLR